MNSERHVKRLNRMLEVELGTRDFLHAWVHDKSLVHPAIEIDGEGKDRFEILCSCGVDVSIHRPSCRMSIARKKVIVVPLCPQYNDQWIICRRMFPSEAEWMKVFGTHVTYPSNGMWYPLSINGDNVVTRPHRLPSEKATEFVIGMVKKWRQHSTKANIAKINEATEHREAKKEADLETHLYEYIKEIAGGGGISLMPGKKMETSYPSVHRS